MGCNTWGRRCSKIWCACHPDRRSPWIYQIKLKWLTTRTRCKIPASRSNMLITWPFIQHQTLHRFVFFSSHSHTLCCVNEIWLSASIECLQAMNMFNFGSHSAQQNQVSAPPAPGDGNRWHVIIMLGRDSFNCLKLYSYWHILLLQATKYTCVHTYEDLKPLHALLVQHMYYNLFIIFTQKYTD